MEYYAIVTVTADSDEEAERVFDFVACEAALHGATLVAIDPVAPDSGGEPHPRLGGI